MINLLSYDLLESIIEYLSIQDTRNILYILYKAMSKDDRSKLLNKRQNPVLYFKQLVDDPEELLTVMLKCKVILAGSRAAEYFYPGTCNHDSDWDFFCAADIRSIALFSKYLTTIGVNFNLDNKKRDGVQVQQVNQDETYDLSLELVQGTMNKSGKKVDIQLISPRQYSSSIENTIGFHSSIVQCAISGLYAVSLYDNISSKGLSLHWSTSLSNKTLIFSKTNLAAVQKYKRRGIKYISYEHYIDGPSKYDKIFDPSSDMKTQRNIVDRYTSHVLFDTYLDLTILDKDYSRILSVLKKYTWAETPYKIGVNNARHESTLNPKLFYTDFRDKEVNRISILFNTVRSMPRNLDRELVPVVRKLLEEDVPWLNKLESNTLIHLYLSSQAEDWIF